MRADLVVTVALLGLFALTSADAFGLPWQAAVAPLLATLTGVGLAVLLIAGLLAGRPGLAVAPGYDSTDLTAFAGFLACVASVLLLGFAWGGALYVFAHLRFAARRRVWSSALAALTVPLFVVGVVEKTLGNQLFDGFLLRAGGW